MSQVASSRARASAAGKYVSSIKSSRSVSQPSEAHREAAADKRFQQRTSISPGLRVRFDYAGDLNTLLLSYKYFGYGDRVRSEWRVSVWPGPTVQTSCAF